MKKTLVSVGIVLTIANTALAAGGTRNVDAIANGAKLTKADAARQTGTRDGQHRVPEAASRDAAPQAGAQPDAPGATLRGIEKKDIRRGMVIADPKAQTPR